MGTFRLNIYDYAIQLSGLGGGLRRGESHAHVADGGPALTAERSDDDGGSMEDLWNPAIAAALAGGTEYGPLLSAFRAFQDRFAGAKLSGDLAAELTADLDGWSERLAAHAVAERDRLDGSRPDLPGRGSPLLPPIVVDERNERGFRARVRFGRFSLGGNAAVHGGALALLFDELFGSTASLGGRGPARTVSLTIDFRAVTLVDTDLVVETRLDRVDGRKRFVSGEVRDNAGDLLVEAKCLCIALKPGQR